MSLERHIQIETFLEHATQKTTALFFFMILKEKKLESMDSLENLDLAWLEANQAEILLQVIMKPES